MSYYISTGSGASAQRSDTTYGMTMTNADYGEVKARTAFVSLPYRQGALDCTPTDTSGKPYMERRTITYDFLVQAADAAELNASLGLARAWFSGITTFYDSFQGATFSEVRLDGCKDEYINMFCTAAKLTVTFTAHPFMSTTGGARL